MKLCLTTYCTIDKQTAKLNGEIVYTASESENFLKEIYKTMELDYSKFYKMDNLSKLGLLGVELLLQKRPELKSLKNDEVGVVLQGRMGCMDSDVLHQSEVNRKSPSPAVFVYTLPNIVIGEISIRNKWYGESIFFIGKNNEFSSLVSYTKSLILSGKSKCCIVGFVDSFEGNHQLSLGVVELENDKQEFSAESLLNL